LHHGEQKPVCCSFASWGAKTKFVALLHHGEQKPSLLFFCIMGSKN
jgi:hypothetical protein